jgi:ATP-dependent exoDNAse (exonuclease V) alpha subunit
MQVENDYDKEVYNGDVGYVTGVEPDGGELTAIFDGRSVTYGLANWTRWCRLTPRRSIRAKAPNTRP